MFINVKFKLSNAVAIMLIGENKFYIVSGHKLHL